MHLNFKVSKHRVSNHANVRDEVWPKQALRGLDGRWKCARLSLAYRWPSDGYVTTSLPCVNKDQFHAAKHDWTSVDQVT